MTPERIAELRRLHEAAVEWPSLLDEVERLRRERDKLRESRDDWKLVARRCKAGTMTVTADTLTGWLVSLRSGHDVIFGHAEANGLADHIDAMRSVARRSATGDHLIEDVTGDPPRMWWASDEADVSPAEHAVIDAIQEEVDGDAG